MTRRTLLTRLFRWGAAAAVAYPFLAFVGQRRYRPPKEIRIHKPMGPGDILVEREFVLQVTEDGAMAVSRHCTHLGCILTFHPEEGIFICPCHQSRFHADGRYISGPANGKDLPRFHVRPLEGGGYSILIPRGVA